jgi:hypothetical protein
MRAVIVAMPVQTVKLVHAVAQGVFYCAADSCLENNPFMCSSNGCAAGYSYDSQAGHCEFTPTSPVKLT